MIHSARKLSHSELGVDRDHFHREQLATPGLWRRGLCSDPHRWARYFPQTRIGLGFGPGSLGLGRARVRSGSGSGSGSGAESDDTNDGIDVARGKCGNRRRGEVLRFPPAARAWVPAGLASRTRALKETG